ncbi:hypothetical protein [Clostridium thailandense]|uniref:hypothetical protein n=1 Tax=Clostridium thailandense TaxID=2794346 RepID=UPI0039898F24
MSTIAYNNIEIKPYNLNSFQDLKIVKKLNEHGTIYFKGIVPEEEKDKYVEMTEVGTNLEVDCIDETSNRISLFKGIVTNIEIKMVMGIYYIEVEGMSHTYNLDIKLKKRSFQNAGMRYGKLIEEVTAPYSGVDFIDTVSDGKCLEKCVVQYDETDWEFLKRMASHFNAALIPEFSANKTKFWFGPPKGEEVGQLEDFNYSISKKIGNFRSSSENYNKSIEENDFIYYKIETDRILNIGDSVSFKDKKLYVFQATATMQDSILKHEYILSPKNGLTQDLVLNNKIKGTSIEGRVIGISGDTVKVHLQIDENQSSGEAYAFPYSTPYTAEGNTGMYCMPEMGDSVKVYFPTNKEEEGIVINSIRRSDGGLPDPGVKMFRTSSGKEIKFTDGEITISANGAVITISDSGIQISGGGVSISGGSISLNAGTITVSAKDSIGLKCKASEIQMSGETSIKGSKVRNN